MFVCFFVNIFDSVGFYMVRVCIIDVFVVKLIVCLNGGWSEHILMVVGDGVNIFEVEISGVFIGFRLEY